MGRIAELFEKKAEGTATEAELKELETLQKEALLLAKQKEEGTEGEGAGASEGEGEGSAEEEVDKLAQRLADSVTSKMSGTADRFEKMLADLEKSNQPVSVQVKDKSMGFIYDQELGKKSVAELMTIKIALPERKTSGKKVTEVTGRTFYMLKALFENDRQKLQILSEGTAADGGYLVPEEFANMIVEDIRDMNIMRQLAATPITITTDTFHIPGLASRPHAAWRGEKAAKNTSTASFAENVLTPYSLAAIVPLSNELVADASLGVAGSIVSYIARLMGTALNEEEEKAFWTGNGSGKPTGIDGGSYSLRTVAAGAGATDSQKADAIIGGFHRTPQGYRNKGVWIANSSTWEEIGRLKDSQGRYLLTDLAGSPTQTLKGRPVYESNYLAGGTALYADLEFYQIVDREGISVRVSDEATVSGQSAFEKNLTYVRAEKRVDAELLLPAAITKVTGLGTI